MIALRSLGWKPSNAAGWTKAEKLGDVPLAGWFTLEDRSRGALDDPLDRQDALDRRWPPCSVGGGPRGYSLSYRRQCLQAADHRANEARDRPRRHHRGANSPVAAAGSWRQLRRPSRVQCVGRQEPKHGRGEVRLRDALSARPVDRRVAAGRSDLGRTQDRP